MRKAGFSLFEVLVASSLLFLILASLTLLVRSYAGSSQASDSHDASLAGARLTLESLRRDGEAALRLLEPALASQVPEPTVRLRRVDPEVVRLPEEYPETPPGLWTIDQANQVIEVDYRMDGDVLLRRVSFSNGSQRTTQLADSMAGFSVTSQADETLLVRCSIRTLQGAPRVLSGRIALRCLDRRP